jgi:hypothetical protein
MLQLARHGSSGTRHGEGLFHLAQNLRLADDHGIEARSHAEQVTDGFLVVVGIEVRRQHLGVDAEVAREEACHRHIRALDDGHQFHAIASGDDHALGDSRRRGQGARGLGQLVAADGDLLPERNGRRLVVHADERQHHCGPNLCTWLKKLIAQTAIITTSAAPER